MTVCTTIGGMVMTVRWNSDDCVYTLYNPRWNGDDCEEASLYCVYNPRWNGDAQSCETVREASLYCVYNPGWNGDDCEVE